MGGHEEDVAGTLIDALADEGEHVDDGGFTLDAAAARTKLREYQLADPHGWVLLAISAGVLATGGRGPIHVRCAGSATTVSFAGVDLSPAQLEHCFAAVFGRERELDGQALCEARVLRLLALAGNAALGFGSTRFRVECTERSGERSVLSVDAAGQSLARDRVTSAEVGLRVTVSGRGDRKPARERALVRERCRYTDAEILLSNERISLGPAAALARTSRTVEVRVGQRTVGYAGFLPDGDDPAKALIINRGVLAQTVTVGGCLPGFVAIVEVDLPMDLSQRQVLRNADWEALLTAIRSSHAELPKPVSRLAGLPSQFGSRPWQIVKRAGPVLAVGILVPLIVISRLDGCDDERLRDSCSAGDIGACKQLLRRTISAVERRKLLERACEADDASSCLEYAEAVYEGLGGRPAPNAGLALLIELCEAGDLRACTRASQLNDGQPRPTLDRAICRVRRALPECTAWLAQVRDSCDDLHDRGCAELREALMLSCRVGQHEVCVEAGWMFALGYGGERQLEVAYSLFKAGCQADDREACAWMSPSLDVGSCLDGDPWACYAIGIEEYKRRRSGASEPAAKWFDLACKAELEVGCEAAARLRRKDSRPPALVLPDRLSSPQ